MRMTRVRWVVPAIGVLTAIGPDSDAQAYAPADDPPLVAAVRVGDAETAQELVEGGADVDAVAVDGTTALHWAAHHDDVGLARVLIEAGANVEAANRYGVQPIALAATNGAAAMLELLLASGADPNAAMPGGETALMTAARAGPADAVRALLAAGADPNRRDDVGGQTALMWAAARNNAAAVRVLAEGGADLHVGTAGEPRPSRSYFRATEPTGFTALLFAVRAGAIEATLALLDAGADVDDTLSDGQSALVVAAANAHWELASRLLDRGADPTAAGAGWNALHQTVRTRRPNPSGGVAGPIPTGRVDSIDLVRKLIAHGVDVDARMTTNGMKDGQRSRLNRLGATAFFLAAKNTDAEAMRVLLEAVADPLIRSADGTTPLMVAAGLGRSTYTPREPRGARSPGAERAVEILLDAGADVNAVNEAGFTALHGAAFRGLNEVIEYLVAQGADIDARDFRGRTAYRMAEGSKQSFQFQSWPETAAFLERLGANARLGIPGTVQERLRDVPAASAANQ